MNDEYLYLWAQWGILNYARYQIILKEFGDLKNAWGKLTYSFLGKLFDKEKTERIWEIRNRIPFTQMLSKMEDLNIHLLSIADDDYPEILKTTADPPPFIFIRGKLPPLHKSLAVVGTRGITDYGKFVTKKFTSDLVRNGFVIVSGLALGVDALAHETTLQGSGITIAVLGSGVDRVYPSTNRRIADNIIKQGGAVISEYPLGSPAMAHHFPERNRIIAGLSQGLLVIEGGVRSGALITARLALDESREVFAIPNNITKTGLSGTNHIIRRGEAKLVERVEHILEEFQMEPVQQQMIFDFSDDETLILKTLSKGGSNMDELISSLNWPIQKLSQTLTQLQIKGAVRESSNKWIIV